MQILNDKLQKRKIEAESVLSGNDRGGYTIPSPNLYPFQWNWDSGFIAIGLTYINPSRAFEEIRNMFKGQWANGFLPHIAFHKPNDNYFPGPEVWGTVGLPQSSKEVITSGITQPPVYGFVLERMTNYLNGKGIKTDSFLKEIFPKVYNFHRYLYTHRDPLNEGLVYIQHNWESGMDNSPVWDDALAGIDLKGARDVSLLRKDNRNVNGIERPTDDNYNRYIYLVDLFNKLKYDDKKIVQESPFLMQDVLFNSLLVKSNKSLIKIGEKLGFDVSELYSWNEKTVASMNKKMWNESDGFYYPYNLKCSNNVSVKTIAGFLPMFAGICSKRQVDRLAQNLKNFFCVNAEWGLCPTTSNKEPSFNPLQYWRGPIWVNLNWMLYHALKANGYNGYSDRVLDNTMKYIQDGGMYEYFDPGSLSSTRKKGLGSNSFSWTAALFLDFIHNPEVF